MRVPSRQRSYGLRFDLTPLNDIVFLLIIFLVASPHFKPTDVQGDVKLPNVNLEKTEESRAERRLEITFLKTGEIRIGGKAVDTTEIRKRLREEAYQYRANPAAVEIRIRADKEGTFGAVKQVLTLCVQAGITNIKFAVLPQVVLNGTGGG